MDIDLVVRIRYDNAGLTRRAGHPDHCRVAFALSAPSKLGSSAQREDWLDVLSQASTRNNDP